MSTCPEIPIVTQPLNLRDKLSLSWRLPLLLIRFATRLSALCLSRDEDDISHIHWRQKLALAFLQALEASLTRKQRAAYIRKLSTGAGIEEYCRKYALSHKAVLGDFPAQINDHGLPALVLHFVKDDASAQPDGPTILYFHGGGYYNPIRAEGHVPFALLCAKASKASQILFLEYSLTPEKPYPCQLVQAVEGLRHLLEGERIRAENIILAGDSAGGHLIASLLAHIANPSPYAAPINLRGNQFRAVVFVSPWLVMPTDGQDGALAEAPNDSLSCETLTRFTEMFKPALNEVWSNPYGAEDAVDVWKKLFPGRREDAVSRKAILAVGTSELLFESCVKFGRDFVVFDSICIDGQASLDLVKEKDFVLAIAPGETHVQPGVDCALKYYDGRMLRSILAFLEAT
ncbi:lipase/thioesterase [Aspergillus insuetus]